jgi:very-short-patch-repair endonuclease
MAHSTQLDEKALAAKLAVQRNVITRQQAMACGMTTDALRHRLRRGGPWRALLPRVYLAVTGAPTVGQREMAALLYAGSQAVVTGPAALRRHGFRTPQTGIVDVLVPARCRRKDIAFVRVHRSTAFPEMVCIDRRICITDAPRAVADTVRDLTSIRDARAVVAEAVQRRFCDVSQLAEELRRGPRRGSALLRQALAEVADGVRSAAEADLHTLLKRSGLPMPMFNPRLFCGRLFIAEPDAWWPGAGVAVEVESREWHLSPEDWENTLERDAEMSKHGIIVLHFTPRQIRTQPQMVIRAITQALGAGQRRPRLPLRAVPAA